MSTMKHKIIHASADAQLAFWAEVVKHFPQATLGDLAPEVIVAFDEACDAAVSHWVELNVMDKGGLK